MQRDCLALSLAPLAVWLCALVLLERGATTQERTARRSTWLTCQQKRKAVGVPGQNFTLTFLITGDAKFFKPEKKAELENLMQMTEFHKIHVQAIQVPKSLQKEVDDDPVA